MAKIDDLSPLALAFLGDAIHTAYVRKHVLEGKAQKLDDLNKAAKAFCNASAQAEALERLQPILTEEECEIVRKTRNAKNKHVAKNCDEKTYKKATSFEALIGWLYMSKQSARLEEILSRSMSA